MKRQYFEAFSWQQWLHYVYVIYLILFHFISMPRIIVFTAFFCGIHNWFWSLNPLNTELNPICQ